MLKPKEVTKSEQNLNQINPWLLKFQQIQKLEKWWFSIPKSLSDKDKKELKERQCYEKKYK
jgi:hypothetical protein